MGFLAGRFEEEIKAQAKFARDVINRWAEFNIGEMQRDDVGNVIDEGDKRCVQCNDSHCIIDLKSIPISPITYFLRNTICSIFVKNEKRYIFDG